MNGPKHNSKYRGIPLQNAMIPLIFLILSSVGLISLYQFDGAGQNDDFRSFALTGMIVLFVILGTCLLFWQANTSVQHSIASSTELTFDERLKGLDEAREFFSGILSQGDAFRLVASRIRDVIEYKTLILYIYDAERSIFTATNAAGEDREAWIRKTVSIDDEILGDLHLTGSALKAAKTRGGAPTAMIPLVCDDVAFGMIQLVFGRDSDLRSIDLSELDAIGSRAAPLLSSSTGFEKSNSNALTDSLTELPNERAFFLVLENQIAEAQRSRGTRSLAILALDLKKFDELNRRFGHSTGDRLLGQTSDAIRENLRIMDFLARSGGDEFLAILPTATEETCQEIIDRLRSNVSAKELKIAETHPMQIELNYGWAIFGDDGETPQALLRAARSRKLESKNSFHRTVIRFPQSLPIDANSR